MNANIDLVRALMQVDGYLRLSMTCNNQDGSIEFSGYMEEERENGRNKSIKITLDPGQVEAIEACQGVLEVYECYREMEYFNHTRCQRGEGGE